MATKIVGNPRGPGADFIFAAILPCFVEISATRSRQPFIPAPPETSRKKSRRKVRVVKSVP